jgi:hypothetical protein
LTNERGEALSAEGLMVIKSMNCSGFAAVGKVSLTFANIGGSLDLSGAKLTSEGGEALSARFLAVGRAVFCSLGFNAIGEVALAFAKIGGILDFNGAELTNKGGDALSANRLTVAQDMFCGEGFVAVGQVSLASAHIGGRLAFSDAKLTADGGVALFGERLIVDHDMPCNGIVAIGEVDIAGAHIGGLLDFSSAKLTNEGGVALTATAVTADVLILPEEEVNGQIGLNSCNFRVIDIPRSQLLIRSRRRAQPAPMYLSGLVYADLSHPDLGVGWRKLWLRRDPDGFHPQPYEQLAAFYRSVGKSRQARLVLLAKQRSQRQTNAQRWPRALRITLGQMWRLPGKLFDLIAGYGYVPWRAAVWLLVAVSAGAIYLVRIGPTRPTSNINLNAVLLALDSVTPTSPFGIREQADLTGTPALVAIVLQVVGYALVLAVLPALSRALSRPDK